MLLLMSLEGVPPTTGLNLPRPLQHVMREKLASSLLCPTSVLPHPSLYPTAP